MSLDHPVLSSLLPVVLLIGIGFVAGRMKLIRGEAVRDLSNLVFLVLVQALLFRTMATSHLERLDLKSVVLYYVVAGAMFFALLLIQGLNSRSAVVALAAIFSNTLMIGVPLVQLAYGQAGLVHLFTLISMHALVLLTLATVVIELLVAREQSQQSPGQQPRRHIAATVARAVKNAILHPVPLPIIAGFLYSLTGLGLAPVVERPLKLLGDAFGPVALVLVGVTLAQTQIGRHLKGALGISMLKTIVHPILMAAAGWALGLRGLPLTVMVVAAALPVGANVFLFSQRYHKAEDLVTASVAVSTAMGLVTISVVMALLRHWA
ncbi:MAG: AEC family transporter [Burkholderiaceae bacterium]|uniref:AEC family transporter n=2 Tax=Ottowia sp. TaxID=1898956 RepID=UPI002BD1A192|nr:AEC family transporter [Ottowia sp.]MCP5258580.1 AEC family transporter [Burkholderiaceae bacterium]HRW73933.1 AEC family transporter [Ottowia sp.]